MGLQTKEKKPTVKGFLEDYFPIYLRDKNRKLYLDTKHMEAVNKMLTCQSKKIGYAVYVCISCGDTKYLYRSCKHRFCVQCGIAETYKWAEKTLSRLMDMRHHHITMTLPQPLRCISKLNGDKLHNLLFQSSSKVLTSWFKSRHGIRPGIVSVLHTAGSDLKYHPHVHMIVSAGGQKIETGEYVKLQEKFLVKQRYLGRQLKLKFGKELFGLYKKGELKVPRRIKDEKGLRKWFINMSEKHWIVSIQDPLEDVMQIVKYVGRYTKRACVSEYKLERIDESGVYLKFNDYKNSKSGEAAVQSIRRFTKTEFLDELLQHVPTKRYRMVRYYGQYSSRYFNTIPLTEKRELELKEGDFNFDEDADWGVHEAYRKRMIELGKGDPLYCECCEQDYVFYAVFYEDESKNAILYEDST